MTNPQNEGFQNVAGQLVAGGIDPKIPLPLTDLEASYALKENLTNISGLLTKVGDVWIRGTRIFNNPLERIVTKQYSEYGGGIEQAMFGPASNHKMTGQCMPWGDAPIVSQVDYVNFAVNSTIHVKDMEVRFQTLNENQLGSYVAEKLKTTAARIATTRYRAMNQLISDVVDGTRSIASSTSTADSEVSVTYAPTVKGYAGAVENIGITVPAVQRGKLVTKPSVDDALTIARTLEGRAADFAYPADDDNKLGIETFTEGRPYLIMETKTLNALDTAFVDGNAASNATAQIGPRTFREYCGRFADIVELDAFADIPTNATYDATKVRLGAVMMDRDSPITEVVKTDTVESFRCTQERATGYSHVSASIISIAKMLNSYAMLFDSVEATE